MTPEQIGAAAALRVVEALLRDYQVRGRDLIREAYRAGRRAIVLVVPTGGGKTITGCAFVLGAVARGRRVVWLVHRRELADQAYARMVASGVPEAMLGVVMADDARTRPDAPIQICSVQTLVARGDRPPGDVVVWDEAHHATSATWRSVAEAYPGALHAGLTATPERADGTALGNVFTTLVAPVTTPELVAAGHLVDCEVIAPKRRLTDGLAWDPVEALQQYAPKRRAVVFAANVAAAQDLAARYTAAGMPAGSVDGTMRPSARAALLAAFRAGELQVIVNVYVLTEGWDCPEAEVCVLARGCGSAATFLQMCGRVLRPAPGKASALLLDLAGVVHQHGLPTEAREYSLDGDPIRQKDGAPPLRTCPVCGRTFRPKPVCPRCKYEFPPPPAPANTGVGLQRVAGVATRLEKLAAWRQICRDGRARGYAPGWAAHKFRERFGYYPPPEFPRFSEVAS